MRLFLERLSDISARMTGWLVISLASCLIGSLLASIFFRYIVGQALSWPEEISLILFAWLVLLAGSLGVREEFHVRLTFLVNRLPIGLQYVLEKAILFVIGIFGVLLIYSGHEMVSRTAQHLTPTVRLPLDWLNYSVVACGALIVLHALPRIFQERRKVGTGE